MENIIHYDVGKIQNFDTTPDGFLRIWGTIAKTGDLLYRNADGSERVEHVPPETLFDQAHLDSIGGAPVTLGHPDALVTPDNWKDFAVGATSTKVVGDVTKGIVDILLIVGARDALDAIENGVTELSMGYMATVEKRNDRLVQVKRVCNHNSIVQRARAQGAKLHVDGWTAKIGIDKPGIKKSDRSSVYSSDWKLISIRI